MPLTIVVEPAPLESDTGGEIRVKGTRITLDTIISTFNEGATAEQIFQQYPALDLADIYSIISYYLKNQQYVENYLQERRKFAQQIRRENESRCDPCGIRERLLARREKKG